MTAPIFGGNCGDGKDTCRDAWHVFDFVGDLDALTCHCGARTMAVVLKRLTQEDLADVPVA